MDAMSLPAHKALASAIFDRTFHPVTGKSPHTLAPQSINTSTMNPQGTELNCIPNLDSVNDKKTVTHPSVIVAMQRIQTTLPPFVGREIWSPQAPHVDVELLVVHTMLRVVELKLCEEEENRIDGDAKMLWAVDWLTRSVDQLGEDDYAFLDPLIAVRMV